MNKIITFITLSLCVFLLISCAQIEALFKDAFVSSHEYSRDVVLTAELENYFKDVYNKAALPEITPSFDIDQIQILNY